MGGPPKAYTSIVGIASGRAPFPSEGQRAGISGGRGGDGVNVSPGKKQPNTGGKGGGDGERNSPGPSAAMGVMRGGARGALEGPDVVWVVAVDPRTQRPYWYNR